MRLLSRIFVVYLLCMPAFSAVSAPVATTSGSNLTAYNPSTAYNNQWANMTNGRYDGNTTAKADFGNCNAVVLRCAQPKCGNGGCTDYSVAGAIVEGCVKSNNKCKQYGDDLVNYMTAQLVANSNAKINQQNAAMEQARLQAEAQAAAAASAAQSEQISQMQNQMYQMQQQMIQQQQESAAQLQEALAAQAAQSQAALDNMKAAATEAAQQTEAGISSYQQEAINRGISNDVLTRQQITGQIMTEIENAQVSLKSVQTAMQNAFNYAGCDARGNNCSGPKRIKKWRDLATGFLTPYDNTIDKIYDALVTAQTVGVDLSQIYMMLNNSCNSWGQYMCQRGERIEYTDGAPLSCPPTTDCIAECMTLDDNAKYVSCRDNCLKRSCKPCTLLKVLSDQEEVYEGWINPTADKDSNGTVVACASNALNNTALFARRTKNKNGAGLVDIDKLEVWLTQTEPSVKTPGKKALNWCYDVKQDNILKSSMSGKKVPTKNADLCVEHTEDDNGFKEKKLGKEEINEGYCPHISGVYAICDTHPYNDGKDNLNDIQPTDLENIKETVGLKITVISQQMYKQYEYLKATLKRLQIQLEKAVLTSNLEAAGAKSEDGSSGGGLLGGGRDSDKTIHLAGAENCSNFLDFDSAYRCLQTNVSLIKSNVASNTKKACLQLQSTVDSAVSILDQKNFDPSGTDACAKYKAKSSNTACADMTKTNITQCADKINFAVMKQKKSESQNNRTGMGFYGGVMP